MGRHRFILFCLTACSPSLPSQAAAQEPILAQSGDLKVIARWAPSATGAVEIRWVHNSRLIRIDTLTRSADTLVVPAAGQGLWDTVVVAVWPLVQASTPLREMVVFATPSHGLRTRVVEFGETLRAGRASADTALALSDDPILADVDFSGGGYSCGGDLCHFPWRRARGIHDESLEMVWHRGAFDYTPVWISFPGSDRLRVSAVFKLSAHLGNHSSNVKVWRISNPNRATIYSPPSSVWGHYWDGWAPGIPNAFIGICERRCPSWVPRNLIFAENIADNAWHTFVWELDVSGSAKRARFWFDGRPIRMTGHWAADGYEDSHILWRDGVLTIWSSRVQPPPDNLGLLEEFSGCCSNEGSMLIDRVVVQSFSR